MTETADGNATRATEPALNEGAGSVGSRANAEGSPINTVPAVDYQSLSPGPKQSLYKAIAIHLEERIKAGEWAPDQQLPSEYELRQQYGTPPKTDDSGREIRPAKLASRTTIREALKLLTSKAMIDSRQGRGTFVAPKYRRFVTTLSPDPETGFGGGEGKAYYDEVNKQNRTPRATKPEVASEESDPKVASALRIEPGTYVITREQKRFVDGEPYSLQTSYYQMSMATEGAPRLYEPADIKEGVVAYLKASLGIEQAGYQDTITVRAPTTKEAEFFRLPADGRVNVYETYRTAYSASGAPFRLTVSVFPADRNIFIINVGGVPRSVAAKPWTPPEPR